MPTHCHEHGDQQRVRAQGSTHARARELALLALLCSRAHTHPEVDFPKGAALGPASSGSHDSWRHHTRKMPACAAHAPALRSCSFETRRHGATFCSSGTIW